MAVWKEEVKVVEENNVLEKYVQIMYVNEWPKRDKGRRQHQLINAGGFEPENEKKRPRNGYQQAWLPGNERQAQEPEAKAKGNGH